MLTRYRLWAMVFLLVVSAGCVNDDAPPAVGCDPVDRITVICGLVAPEDIERTPDNSALVVGVMGVPGGLLLLDPATDAVTEVYGEQSGRAEAQQGEGGGFGDGGRRRIRQCQSGRAVRVVSTFNLRFRRLLA